MREAQDIKNDQAESDADETLALQRNRSLAPSSDPPQLPAGFQFIEILGEGGASIVSKAFEARLQQTVAIKVLKDCDSPETDLSRKLMRESRAIAKLDHPNIVKLFQVGYTPTGAPYLVYEFLSGLTLEQAMKNDTLHPAEYFVIFDEILKGLSHIHNSGLVHRDIKPSNVILTHGATVTGAYSGVKILDFGIAKEVFEGDDPTATTSSGSLVGSPPYMSPEQCQRKKLDGRSDLYAVACMLYEALSKKRVFSGNTPMDIMYKQIHEAPPPLPELGGGPAFQSAISTLISQALSKNPDGRPSTAAEFRTLLYAAANLHSDAVPSRISMPKAKLSQPMLVAAAFLSALLLLGYGIFRTQSNQVLDKKLPWKKTNVRALSISSQIKAISSDMKVAENHNAKSQAEVDFFLKRIDEITPQLKSPADRFAVHFLRARLYEWTNQWSKVIEEKTKCIECCQRSDGRVCIEAADCFYEIGRILRDLKMFNKAKESLLRAKQILYSRDTDYDNVVSLNLPPEYNVRLGPDFEHRNLNLLADIYYAEGDFKHARENYQSFLDRLDAFNRVEEYMEARLRFSEIIEKEEGTDAAKAYLSDSALRLSRYRYVSDESVRVFDKLVEHCQKKHWDSVLRQLELVRKALVQRVQHRNSQIKLQLK
jgi:serine/threonine protein kinase